MGNSFFCNRCDIEKFELSRTCADQFLNNDKEILSEEQRWMQRLKCLDDAHSRNSGISEQAFNDLVDGIEKRIEDKEVPVFCENRFLVIECLEQNPNCVLNCKRQMDDFIDCVDSIRVKKIKERIKEQESGKKVNIDTMFN